MKDQNPFQPRLVEPPPNADNCTTTLTDILEIILHDEIRKRTILAAKISANLGQGRNRHSLPYADRQLKAIMHRASRNYLVLTRSGYSGLPWVRAIRRATTTALAELLTSFKKDTPESPHPIGPSEREAALLLLLNTTSLAV